jgi:hypothetical protein
MTGRDSGDVDVASLVPWSLEGSVEVLVGLVLSGFMAAMARMAAATASIPIPVCLWVQRMTNLPMLVGNRCGG